MNLNLANKEGFLNEMARRVTLREGATGVENILRALFDAYNKPGAEPLNERVVARIARLPVPVVSALCKELIDEGVLNPGSPLHLDEAAVRVMGERWGWAAATRGGSGISSSAQCHACESTGIAPLGVEWLSLMSALRRYNIGNAQETTLRLIATMHDQAALFGKDVLVIGGGGAISAAVALAGKSLSPSGRLARRIVVADPLDRNLMRLRDTAVQADALIGLVRHDLARPLPGDLQGEFDTVVVSAPADLKEFVLLLNRAVEAAKDDGQVFLLWHRMEPAEAAIAQREMIDMGLMFKQVTPFFDKHPGAEADLYVLGVVEE